jgi:hypothetical protein
MPNDANRLAHRHPQRLEVQHRQAFLKRLGVLVDALQVSCMMVV